MNDFIASLMLLGAIGSSDSYLPYWMTTNQWGLMPERNGSLVLIQAGTRFDDQRTFQWRWGASAAANSFDNPLDPASSPRHIMVDQLYGSLRWQGLTLDVGQRRRDLDFYGSNESLGSLSVTGGHVVESGNARPMPGYTLTLDPLAVPFTGNHFWIYGAYGDYDPTDVRYVEGALVHRMRLGFRYTIGDRLALDAMLDHYAVWAGVSPRYGQLPNTFKDYLRMATGRPAGANGPQMDRANVLGDQGGGELFKLTYRGDGWTMVAQHDIPYNDGSGMGFQNFPDGVNTICFSWKDKDRWISDVLYEYHYTMFQSGTFCDETFDAEGNKIKHTGKQTTGGDQYFWNGMYQSSWTHYGHIIGDPLCLPKGVHEGTWTSAHVNMGVENNRLKAHHLGVSGKLFHKHPYRLMLTYSDNYGDYKAPYIGESQWNHKWGTVKETGLKQFSAAFNGMIENVMNINGLNGLYGLYLDKGELYKNSFGITLGVKYSFSN